MSDRANGADGMLSAPFAFDTIGVGGCQFANRRGWVLRIEWPVLPSAHHLEKSATSFKDASIHRLPYRCENPLEGSAHPG